MVKSYLETALQIAVNAHNGQRDKGGAPYIFHPIRVAEALDKEEDKIVALLHDVVEDCGISYEYLQSQGFSEYIIEGLKGVTRQNGETYDEFITRANKNNISRKVKIADLKDNMNLSRIPNPTERDFDRIRKYQRALAVLTH